MYIQNQFINWREIEALDLKRMEHDTISYSLVVYKDNGKQLEQCLDWLNEDSKHIFSFIKNTFETNT